MLYNTVDERRLPSRGRGDAEREGFKSCTTLYGEFSVRGSIPKYFSVPVLPVPHRKFVFIFFYFGFRISNVAVNNSTSTLCTDCWNIEYLLIECYVTLLRYGYGGLLLHGPNLCKRPGLLKEILKKSVDHVVTFHIKSKSRIPWNYGCRLWPVRIEQREKTALIFVRSFSDFILRI